MDDTFLFPQRRPAALPLPRLATPSPLAGVSVSESWQGGSTQASIMLFAPPSFLVLSAISVNIAMASRLGVISSFVGDRCKIMTTSAFGKYHRSMDIIPVKAAGSIGDTGNDGEILDTAPTSICTLLHRACRVRSKLYKDDDDIGLPPFVRDASRLSYPSSVYNMNAINHMRKRNHNEKAKTVQRGFCNWLVPQMIMIGQYPGQTPETNGPTSKECELHVRNMVRDANVSLFCCLQTEVPSQEDDIGWRDCGEVYLEPQSVRREFPRPFTRYGPMARSFAESSQLTLLHNPIEDLSVPSCNDSLLSLLSQLLLHLENNDDDDSGAIYLHCWGGRGRAGLIGSCLGSLLFPELSSIEVLEWVQRGYDTRLGAESMPKGLRRSPQTEGQRGFVKEFVNIVHAEKDANGINVSDLL